MPRRNDQVFQVSLTEIAFTIAFLLLLMLGYVVFREQRARIEAEAELARSKSVEQARAELSDVRRQFEVEIKAAGLEANDKTIAALVEAKDVREERDRLKHEVDDLDARLSALVELQRELAAAAPASAPALERDDIVAALALRERVRAALAADDATEAAAAASAPASAASSGGAGSGPGAGPGADDVARVEQALATTGALRRRMRAELGRDLVPGQEDRQVAALVDAARIDQGAGSQAAETTADLRGQVAFLRNRLGAHGGRDFPPCWADDAGKVEFLFSIRLTPAGILVAPDWPARRDAAAHALPGVASLVGGPWSAAEFERRTRPLLDDSRAQSPECRHYVALSNTLTDAVLSDRERLLVEGVFYKVEERR